VTQERRKDSLDAANVLRGYVNAKYTAKHNGPCAYVNDIRVSGGTGSRIKTRRFVFRSEGSLFLNLDTKACAAYVGGGPKQTGSPGVAFHS